jgi:predicted transcriptional regulator
MKVHLTREQEAHFAELATRKSRSAEELIREVSARYLDDEARFAEAVKLGLTAADSGDFVPADEVWAAVERTLQS